MQVPDRYGLLRTPSSQNHCRIVHRTLSLLEVQRWREDVVDSINLSFRLGLLYVLVRQAVS